MNQTRNNPPPPKPPRHGAELFEMPQRFATLEESEDAIPVFTTPTHMYLQPELNPRPRFPTPRSKPTDYQTKQPEEHTSSSSSSPPPPPPPPSKAKRDSPQTSAKESVLAQLVEMGFRADVVRMSLERCADDCQLHEVLDEVLKGEGKPRGQDRKEGNLHFNQGRFAEAETAYTTAIEQLLPGHPDRVLLLNNRAAARLKLGRYEGCLEDCHQAITLASQNTARHQALVEGVRSWPSQWLKALHRKACALEALQRFDQAKEVYQAYAALDGASGSVVTQGLARCEQKISQGQPWQPATETTTTAFPDIDFNLFLHREEINASKAVQAMRAREKKKEREDLERLEKTDAVNTQLAHWKSGKENNLRALLSSLETILWSSVVWKPVTMADLLQPRQCKVTYMKAIAKVHPDKLSSQATVEQRLLASESMDSFLTFDPKKWINDALSEKEDDLKETTVWINRIQMAGQDCSQQFQQVSDTVLKHMPRTLHELKTLSEQAQTVQTKIVAAQKKLSLLQGQTGDTLEHLARPALVKTRMESCQHLLDYTLQTKIT
ncbi:hypothetical protein BY458DRAFT_453088 [Sporodiniella umbellata]|nr:hypothetical protein BY458DRAFT_453088 [Sporodiniella umbellata]